MEHPSKLHRIQIFPSGNVPTSQKTWSKMSKDYLEMMCRIFFGFGRAGALPLISSYHAVSHLTSKGRLLKSHRKVVGPYGCHHLQDWSTFLEENFLLEGPSLSCRWSWLALPLEDLPLVLLDFFILDVSLAS